MDYFPLFLKLTGQPCLIVGGGEVAARKAGLLLDAGAALTVIANDLHPNLAEWHAAGRLNALRRAYQSGDERGQRLVVAATDDRQTNETVFNACEAANILVNVVDDPQQCRFIVPSIIDRSPLMLALSTGGRAPMLARLLRVRLEVWLPQCYGKLAELAGRMREAVRQRFAGDPASRQRFWQRVFEGPVAEHVLAGNVAEAEERLRSDLVSENGNAAQGVGVVYLVGAGPGHPDLLTFRALRLMQQADVVLYDKLVSKDIVAQVRHDTERIYVGKQADKHPLPQEEINRLMIQLASAGKTVLRLKGGDPFIFGRGGEEIEALVGAGIPFQVVPGITAAAGASCYAGIPLTHRDHAQSVTFVTGHRRAGQVELDWPRLTSDKETVVVYMGVQEAPAICQQLIIHGRAPETPAAIIERATTDKQRTIIGSLGSLPRLMENQSIKPPALIIIGSVVSLHEKLEWRA